MVPTSHCQEKGNSAQCGARPAPVTGLHVFGADCDDLYLVNVRKDLFDLHPTCYDCLRG